MSDSNGGLPDSNSLGSEPVPSLEALAAAAGWKVGRGVIDRLVIQGEAGAFNEIESLQCALERSGYKVDVCGQGQVFVMTASRNLLRDLQDEPVAAIQFRAPNPLGRNVDVTVTNISDRSIGICFEETVPAGSSAYQTRKVAIELADIDQIKAVRNFLWGFLIRKGGS